jgi:hypothetical protein
MITRYIYDETIGFVIKYMEEFKHVRFQIWDENEKKNSMKYLKTPTQSF